MATTEQQIAFKIDIIGQTEGAKSLSDLKAEFKALQKILSETKEGTENYQKALQKLGAVKDDIGDLRDTINALNPEGKVAAFAKVGSTIASGFAAAQGAAALFGAESEELQKTMLKVQAAMALAEGIKGITAASDAFAVLNTVMRANPIGAIVTAFSALAVTAVALYQNFAKTATASEDLAKQLAKVDEENKHINASLKAQITALSGLKENEDEIFAVKEKGFKLDIERQKLALQHALVLQMEAEASSTLEEQLLRMSGQEKQADILRFSRLKEQREATKTAIDNLGQAISGLAGLHNELEQKKLDKTKEINDKSREEAERSAKEKAAIAKKYLDEQLAYQKAAQDEIDKYIHDTNVAARKRLEEKREEEKVFNDEDLNNNFAYIDSRDEKIAESNKKEREERQKTLDNNLAATKQGLQATQSLTDLYFAHQLRQVKGQADKEREIRKKQFQLNKAFGIANAVVDGIGAVQKALNNPYPLNIVLAVISGLAAAVNIAKIASAKFDDGGGSSGSAGDVGSLGSTAQAPVIPQPNNTTTKISDDGKVENSNIKTGPQEVVIYEGKMSDAQKRSVNIEETAKIG